jgi:hypothetical protein
MGQVVVTFEYKQVPRQAESASIYTLYDDMREALEVERVVSDTHDLPTAIWASTIPQSRECQGRPEEDDPRQSVCGLGRRR